MAHLPPGADMWIQDVPVVSDESRPVSEITFPTLAKGVTYNFTVRARWVEDGKWVSQTHTFPIKAGEVHCVSVVPSGDPAAEKAVAEGLEKLGPVARAAAAAQRYCAVQGTIRLGSMGPPVRVSVNGKDVYLCCPGCRLEALKDPDKTLQTAERNRDKK
jgi:hypothetical protein